MNAASLIDLAFPVEGDSIQEDHGYLLFSALCEAVPRLGFEPGWALHLVDGQCDGGSRIRLGPESVVQMRLPARDLGEALSLTGRDLSIGADHVRLGLGQVVPLAPKSRLRSAAVTIPGRLGKCGLDVVLRHELDALPLAQDVNEIGIHAEGQRLLRARVRTVVGFEVELSGLRPHASLCIQAQGLGARRHMGCGVFS